MSIKTYSTVFIGTLLPFLWTRSIFWPRNSHMITCFISFVVTSREFLSLKDWRNVQKSWKSVSRGECARRSRYRNHHRDLSLIFTSRNVFGRSRSFVPDLFGSLQARLRTPKFLYSLKNPASGPLKNCALEKGCESWDSDARFSTFSSFELQDCWKKLIHLIYPKQLFFQINYLLSFINQNTNLWTVESNRQTIKIKNCEHTEITNWRCEC